MAEPNTTTTGDFSAAANTSGKTTITFTPLEKAQIEREARTAHNAHMAQNLRIK